MKTPRYHATRRAGVNMTPMIDVVFLLIIFFLVSSHLARQENQIQLPLPVAESGDEDLDFATPRITVNVKTDGTIWIAGRPIAPAQLETSFRQVLDNEGSEVEVRIRASRDTTYASVEPILLACTKANIWNVSFAVYREGQP